MKYLYPFLTLLSLLLITSCAYENSSYTGWDYNENSRYDYRLEDLDASTDLKWRAVEGVEEPRRKVIFNAQLYLTVKEPDTTIKSIEALANKYGGYISETGTFKTMIRVKSEHFDAAVEEIEAMGEVTSKRVTGKDVSDQYLDYQIRLENALTARDRYLELLEKAASVEEALLVEIELERLNGTIDELKGKMSRLDHLEEFSTITVYVSEKKKPGILGYIGVGIYKGVKWLFVRN